jgi:hypothetical protein
VPLQTDFANHIIRHFDISSGTVTTLAGLALASGSDDAVGSNARFYLPYGVALNAAWTFALVVSGGCLWEDIESGFEWMGAFKVSLGEEEYCMVFVCV